VYTDRYYRSWQGPFSFNLGSARAHTPKTYGVYQILYKDHGKLIPVYVGIATGATIRERLSKHVSSSHNWALKRITTPDHYCFVYYECDPKTAQQIESHITCDAKPPYNAKRELRHYIPSVSLH